jgi:poly(A) polymerase/tRNA nucleotidyltransferase (CCA-adding enzyme)
VRLAALLHDIAKPKTHKVINGIATFYNHEYLGAKMTAKIMSRLKFSREDSERVVNLVKNHMFYYNVGEVTAASVRRLIVKVGRDNLQDLIDLRVADRLGSGTPKAMPYKLRHLQYMFEKVQNDPVSVKMLKINGDDLIAELKILPGPKIGAILEVLLGEVIEDPTRNVARHLMARAKELNSFNLEELRAQAKAVIEEKRASDDKEIKKQFKV